MHSINSGQRVVINTPAGWRAAEAGGQISWANKRRESTRHATHKLGLLHKSPRTLQEVRAVARLVANLLNAEIGGSQSESERAFYCIITQFGANKAAKQNWSKLFGATWQLHWKCQKNARTAAATSAVAATSASASGAATSAAAACRGGVKWLRLQFVANRISQLIVRAANFGSSTLD